MVTLLLVYQWQWLLLMKVMVSCVESQFIATAKKILYEYHPVHRMQSDSQDTNCVLTVALQC